MLWLDIESYSTTPIGHGVVPYANAATVLLLAYATDDDPVKVWDLTATPDVPDELRMQFLNREVRLVAHNSFFDRTVLTRDPKFAAIADEIRHPARWFDTMAKAYAHSLPGSLSDLCRVLGLPADKSKDTDARKLMLKFTAPRVRKGELVRIMPDDDPEGWARFVEYARRDVEAMREVCKRMPSWNFAPGDFEYEVWCFDQRINDYGVGVDLDLARAAVRALEKARADTDAEITQLTGGLVTAGTQVAKIVEFLRVTYGLQIHDLQKDTVERLLNSKDLPPDARRLLQSRVAAGSTSTAKYAALIDAAPDGVLCGSLQYAGASRTGRWAGRIFQPQNLPRPDMHTDDIALGIQALKADCADLLGYDVTRLAVNALRGCIVARSGYTLAVADLSQIEGRVLPWLAGEQWKVDAFRAYDEGRGPDIYRASYAASFSVPVESVTDDQRQIGKVQELALGYGGGVGAFVTFAQVYRLNLDDLAATAKIPARVLDESKSFLHWLLSKRSGGNLHGLTVGTWHVCDALKRLWREAHPGIVAFWKNLESAVSTVLLSQNNAKKVTVGRLVVDAGRVKGDDSDTLWLRIRLPSGRYLSYPSPELNERGLSYMHQDSITKQWMRVDTYGGKLAENITQAVSRDILAHNMLKLPQAGFWPVLTVHDEVITETTNGAVERLVQVFTQVPPWADGLPIAAKGFLTDRYKKD